eukprot:CAMPEP_0194346614 /NCGR_PEP_ID=MMETSP0171-20130528/105525_1 /TAXON_ID=218684 /ORGANISM="Corethron pennatum, Strain L29A3" /LENGTH=168 /DNA_ID=CAMNT_0039113761 /DNA_START=186 /DNA_END=692 /DNA_ORIENTATION=-
MGNPHCIVFVDDVDSPALDIVTTVWAYVGVMLLQTALEGGYSSRTYSDAAAGPATAQQCVGRGRHNRKYWNIRRRLHGQPPLHRLRGQPGKGCGLRRGQPRARRRDQGVGMCGSNYPTNGARGRVQQQDVQVWDRGGIRRDRVKDAAAGPATAQHMWHRKYLYTKHDR